MSGKKERVTITLDPDVLEGVKAAAAQLGAASVSEYVEGAVAARLVRDERLTERTEAVEPADLDGPPLEQ
jgi:metal-responsive CopG/Arc/MetJ family transcriptional regulator